MAKAKSRDAIYIASIKSRIDTILTEYSNNILDATNVSSLVQFNNIREESINNLKKEFSNHIFTDITLPECVLVSHTCSVRQFVFFEFRLEYKSIELKNDNTTVELAFETLDNSEVSVKKVSYARIWLGALEDSSFSKDVKCDIIEQSYDNKLDVSTCILQLYVSHKRIRMCSDNILHQRLCLKIKLKKANSGEFYSDTRSYLSCSESFTTNVYPLGIHLHKLGRYVVVSELNSHYIPTIYYEKEDNEFVIHPRTPIALYDVNNLVSNISTDTPELS
ncbi:MAG: hypothetical protein ACRDD8_03895, partial [Bacteroidales bacterium]